MVDLSVIIPTYNRLEVLKRVLAGYSRQTLDPSRYEIIVYDDCSAESPEKEVMALKMPCSLRFFRMPKNSGQGMVRNRALEIARGRYVLFTGDDMIPDARLLEEHMRIHDLHPGIAVLGHIAWADEVRNELMNFLEGIQFHYNTIHDRNNVKDHFYTSNISLEKKWFDTQKFCDQFHCYGLEDLELGYRLEKDGLRTIYNPRAKVYHLHQYSHEQFVKRMRNVGKSAVIYGRLHPERRHKYMPIAPAHQVVKLGSYVLSRHPVRAVSKKLCWYADYIHSYLCGIEDGVKEQDSATGWK